MSDSFTVPAYIGTIGWGYSDWNGVFYPDSVPMKQALPHYARTFNSVEIDSSFYGTPKVATVQNWAKSVPDNFIFCPKTPRLITHDLGLIDAEEPLDRKSVV